MRKLSKSAKKHALQIGAALSTGLTTAYVHAASQLPATVVTSLTTDMTDTYEDVMAWTWSLFPIIAIGWFAFNQARKGAGKFGAK